MQMSFGLSELGFGLWHQDGMLGLAILMRSKQSWGSVTLHQCLSEEP